MACPLYRAGRLASSGPRLVEGLILAASTFVIVTSAYLKPMQGRVGFVECSLGLRNFRLWAGGAGMGVLVSEALREALCRGRRGQVSAVALSRVRGGQLVTLPRSWRYLASRCPRARQAFFRLLLVDRRVEAVGRCALESARVGVAVVVEVLVALSSPSRFAGPRSFPSFSLGLLDGARGGPHSARVARIVTGRHGAGSGGGGGRGRERGRRVKERRRSMFCCGVPAASNEKLYVLKRSEAKTGRIDPCCGAAQYMAAPKRPRPSHQNRQLLSYVQCRG